MIEYMIIALIIAKFCEKGAIDIVSMATGNQPPSMAVQKAKKGDTEDGPLAKAFKAWWADAIEDLDENRRIKRMETKEEQERARAERKAERQRILDRIEEKAAADKAEREAREAPAEETPHSKDEGADSPPPFEAETQWPEDQPKPWEDEKYAWKGRVISDEELEEERRARAKEDQQAGPDQTIPDIPVEDLPEVEEAKSADDDHPVDGTVDPDQPQQAKGEPEKIYDADVVEDAPRQMEPGPEGPEIPNLQIIQGGRDNDQDWTVYGKPQLHAVADRTDEEKNTTGGTEMTSTQVAAVEGGITQHIHWTQQVADYQSRAMGHVEIVGASMFKGDNGPARLALVRLIMAKHIELRELYLQLNAILVHDKNLVGDAYAATGGQAGGKPYVTN